VPSAACMPAEPACAAYCATVQHYDALPNHQDAAVRSCVFVSPVLVQQSADCCCHASPVVSAVGACCRDGGAADCSHQPLLSKGMQHDEAARTGVPVVAAYWMCSGQPSPTVVGEGLTNSDDWMLCALSSAECQHAISFERAIIDYIQLSGDLDRLLGHQ
jgi:hypothetical protein